MADFVVDGSTSAPSAGPSASILKFENGIDVRLSRWTRCDLLLHPVRLRIVHAMSGGRIAHHSDLCASLPDVSKATVYRHVGLLAEAGAAGGRGRTAGARRRRTPLPAAPSAGGDRPGGGRVDVAWMSIATGSPPRWLPWSPSSTAYLDRARADPTADTVGIPADPALAQSGRTCRADQRDTQHHAVQDGQRTRSGAQAASAEPDPVSDREHTSNIRLR